MLHPHYKQIVATLTEYLEPLVTPFIVYLLQLYAELYLTKDSEDTLYLIKAIDTAINYNFKASILLPLLTLRNSLNQ